MVEHELPSRIYFNSEDSCRVVEVSAPGEIKSRGWLYIIRDSHFQITSVTQGGTGYPTNMEIIWFGTATLSISSGGESILFDPFLPLNAELPAPSIEELAALGDIFITHGHFDHLMHVPQAVPE